jgi:hypothetical protein
MSGTRTGRWTWLYHLQAQLIYASVAAEDLNRDTDRRYTVLQQRLEDAWSNYEANDITTSLFISYNNFIINYKTVHTLAQLTNTLASTNTKQSSHNNSLFTCCLEPAQLTNTSQTKKRGATDICKCGYWRPEPGHRSPLHSAATTSWSKK